MRSLAILCVFGFLAINTTSCGDDDEPDDGTGGKKSTGGDSSTGGTATGGADNAGGEVSSDAGSNGGPATGECGFLGVSTCDPLTAEPCDVAMGETCDYIGDSFVCIPGPNDAVACDECGPDVGISCGAGTNCNVDNARCEKYCCADADCGTGFCNQGLFDGEGLESVGICTDEAEDTCG